MVVTDNSYQRATVVNSSNYLTGTIYARVNAWKSYLYLAEENAKLAAENAALREQLQLFTAADSTEQHTVTDTARGVQYRYIVAKVTNNSIHQLNNYITLDKGSRHGITKGMGVISSDGIVGIVLNVSEHFSTVQSLLHSETRISAELEDSHAFGSLMWGNNFDARRAILRDIPNHVKVRKGERVFTSGFSLFPPGISVGRVIETGVAGGDSFLDIRVELSTQFHNLQQVFVVQDLLVDERKQLEAQNDNNG